MFKTKQYFGGNVKSIAFDDAVGPATLGVMAPGEYEFGTTTREVMQLVSGELQVQLPGEAEWKIIRPGNTFEVAAELSFSVKLSETSTYLCRYG